MYQLCSYSVVTTDHEKNLAPVRLYSAIVITVSMVDLSYLNVMVCKFEARRSNFNLQIECRSSIFENNKVKALE